jgi:hypothetical protein
MNKTMDRIISENSLPVKMLSRQGNGRRLFFTAFFQVLLVSANTYFISRVAWIGIAVCGFGISYLWTLNVKRISAGSTAERVIYASGAMLGGITGVLLSKLILV